MKKILFATDGSDCARKAGEMAKDFLNMQSDATMMALYVKHPVYTGVGIMGYVPDVSDEPYEAIAKEIEAGVRETFSAWPERVMFKSLYGPPAQVICSEAEDFEADLIIVGSHGHHAIDHLFLGSVSHGVVQRSKIPVLVVKQHE